MVVTSVESGVLCRDQELEVLRKKRYSDLHLPGGYSLGKNVQLLQTTWWNLGRAERLLIAQESLRGSCSPKWRWVGRSLPCWPFLCGIEESAECQMDDLWVWLVLLETVPHP